MSVNSLFLSVHNIDAFACNAVQFASVEAVDDYMELHDDLDDSEVIAKRLARHDVHRRCNNIDADKFTLIA